MTKGNIVGICSICLEKMEEKEMRDGSICVLPCKHKLHGSCMSQYLEVNKNNTNSRLCPLCRASIDKHRKELRINKQEESEDEILSLMHFCFYSFLIFLGTLFVVHHLAKFFGGASKKKHANFSGTYSTKGRTNL